MAASSSTRGKVLVGVDTTMYRPKVKPPKELKGDARVYWKRIVDSVPNQQFTKSDFAILVAYCQNYALLIKAQDKLEVEGEVLIAESTGKAYKNPWFVILQEVSGKIATMATKLRVCPSARQRSEATKEKPTPNVKVDDKRKSISNFMV